MQRCLGASPKGDTNIEQAKSETTNTKQNKIIMNPGASPLVSSGASLF